MPQIVTKVIEVNIEEILPNRFQPRIKFNEEEMKELTKSIKEYGVIQPIVVRKVFDKYEIIAGERRYKASVLAGKNTIPVVVVDLNDKESAEIALIENVQRKDLTPIEEAISYKRILDMGYTQETLASKLGKDQSTLANKLRLLNLSDDVQNALLDGKISERHARTLLKLTNPETQKQMVNRIIDERLTVRQTEEEVKKMGQETMNSEIISNPFTIKEETIPSEKPAFNTNIPNIGIWDEEETVTPTPAKAVEIAPTEVVTDVADILNTWEKPETKDNLNPGFMNINKIEKEASDIYVEKPLADTGNLLKEEETIAPLPAKEEDENEIVPGKFFTLFANEEDEADDNNDIRPLEQPIGFDMYNQDEFVPKETKEEVIEIPNNDKTEFMDFFNQKPLTETIVKPDEIIAKEEVTPKATIEPDFISSIPSTPTSTFELKDIIPEVEDIVPIKEEVVVSTPPVTSIKKAIDAVRACADELEALGYKIDLEEFDYENMYQVIFKIEK